MGSKENAKEHQVITNNYISSMPNQSVNPAETEVDFVYLAKTIWKRKLLVVILTGIAALAGMTLSLLSPNQYTISTTFVQEITDTKITLNEAKLSAISALAAIAGVDLNSLTKAKMSPLSYSNIFSSLPFRRELLKTKITPGKADSTLTLYDYLSPKGHGYPRASRQSVNLPKGDAKTKEIQTDANSLPQMTREEMAVNKMLDKRLSIQLMDDEFITIRCTMPDATAAAQVTLNTERLMQHYLTEIQTEKARANLKFIQERFDEAKMNFMKAREELDGATIKTDASRLSASYKVAESVYSDLSRKLEQSKIVLQEQTPVFKIINPVTLPTGVSSPDWIKITSIFSFLGFVLAMILILGKGFFEETKEKWKSN